MKALSLSRPWTTLVLHHGKDVENRTWGTTYRGPLVIHGAMSWDPTAVLDHVRQHDELHHAIVDVSIIDRSAHPTGLLGIVDLVGVCPIGRPCDCSPWAMRMHAHWRLRNPRPFPEPIPCRGALGLWTVPAGIQIPTTGATA